ncbi:DNA helicase MCM9 [Lamellibrachia satsuma]|nr:DNA helicase MCM9 [Lamellibrachia satsuma]
MQSYALEYHQEELLQMLQEDDEADHYSVTINALTLFESSTLMGDTLLSLPRQTLPLFDRALLQAQQTVLKALGTAVTGLSLKRNIHARITGLPVCPELTRDVLPKTSDVGSFLSVTGTVIRATTIKLLDCEKEFVCNQCRHVFTVEADFEQYYSVCRPSRCPNESGLQQHQQLHSSGRTRCRNYQELKIQEQVQRLGVGTIPRSMWAVLEDDLVDSCKPGDDVTISGVVMRRWRPVTADSRCHIELVLKANHVQVTNEQRSSALTYPGHGNAKAVDMMDHFRAGVLECGLNVKQMVQISMDGPNVNWALIDLMKKTLSDNFDSTLINIGSCGLHIVYNSFKAGITSSGWIDSDFLSSL